MRGEAACDVSVVLPFGDDEECVGALARRAAEHLRALGLRFEIVAVDEESGDNSVAVLNLLVETGCLPELRVLAAEPGMGFAAGIKVARGRVLWLLDAARAGAPFGPFGRAHARVAAGVADLVVLRSRFVVGRRTRVWRALEGVRGRGEIWQRRAARRAAGKKLHVEHGSPGDFRPWAARALGLLRSWA